MQMQYELTTPCTAADLAPLKAGDTVLLSGVVYTARDQAHRRMLEALDKGEKLPFDLEGSAIYYVGPTPERPGEVIGSAGPTTSGRMDAYAPTMMSVGARGMIGKGRRNAAVIASMKQHGAVLAKGWLMGLQFAIMLENGEYFERARQADKLAMQIRGAFEAKGIPFWAESFTNQQFVILNERQRNTLARSYYFEEMGTVPQGTVGRFCTSWATSIAEVNSLLADIAGL